MATFDLMIPIKRQDDSFSLELKKKKKNCSSFTVFRKLMNEYPVARGKIIEF